MKDKEFELVIKFEQAIRDNNTDEIQKLLEIAKADGFDIVNSPTYAQSPLQIAIENRANLKTLLLLLTNNANPNVKINGRNLFEYTRDSNAIILLILAGGGEGISDNYKLLTNKGSINFGDIKKYIKTKFSPLKGLEILESILNEFNISSLPTNSLLELSKMIDEQVLGSESLSKIEIVQYLLEECALDYNKDVSHQEYLNNIINHSFNVLFTNLLRDAKRESEDKKDIHQGPLNKSKATHFLEQIVKGIANGEITDFKLIKDGKQIKMSYVENGQNYVDNLTVVITS